MANSTPESDWKCMKKVQDDLLATLCERINKQSVSILQATHGSEHEKYQKHFKHTKDSDRIVAECFDDWRRSTLILKLIALQRHDLLTEEQMRQLSEETQRRLKVVHEL